MSLFEIDKELVIKSCNNAIAQIGIKRKNLFEERLKTINKKPKLYLFILGIKSEEDAKKYLLDLDDDFIDFKFAGWQTEGTANKLIKACKVSKSNTVFLDTSDAAFVQEWSNTSS